MGGIGHSNTLKYKNENGVIKVNEKTYNIDTGIFTLANDLYNGELKISKDSLIIIKTGEIFYEENFIKLKK